jgi:hypothetical protein
LRALKCVTQRLSFIGGPRLNCCDSDGGPRVRIHLPPAERVLANPDALDQVAENFAERLRVTGRMNRCAGAGCAPVGRDHSLSHADDRRRL